jgi:glycosyltransferase involved in cell wall biosynthesis
MRILLLSDNYPPETTAGALRSSAHAKIWAAQGHEVTVITSFPNFPDGKVFEGYRQKLSSKQIIDGVTVIRVPTLIFPNAGIFKRIIDFVSFMITGTLAGLVVKRPDVVIATSPQFFAAAAGWLVGAARRRPFVFELRDLWPESIVAVGALSDNWLLGPIRKFEYFLYRKATAIVSVTNAFRDHLVARGINSQKISVVRNGVDISKFSPGDGESIRQAHGLKEKTIVSYIGTIGMAHGLSLLLDTAEILRATNPSIVILILGTGADRDQLRDETVKRNIDNIVFVDRVAHDRVIEYWRGSDMTLVLLRDSPLFRTVIPSKIFEAMATGTPIITNVRGEVEQLLRPLDAAVFVEPGNAVALAEAIARLSSDKERRLRISTAGVRHAPKFDRAAQAELMLTELKRIARHTTN